MVTVWMGDDDSRQVIDDAIFLGGTVSVESTFEILIVCAQGDLVIWKVINRTGVDRTTVDEPILWMR